MRLRCEVNLNENFQQIWPYCVNLNIEIQNTNVNQWATENFGQSAYQGYAEQTLLLYENRLWVSLASFNGGVCYYFKNEDDALLFRLKFI